MKRKKQHRATLKGLLRDERMSPGRAILAERLLKCLDAIGEDAVKMYEMMAINHLGGPSLVEEFIKRNDSLPDTPPDKLLRDSTADGGHLSLQNRLLRDTRSHPNQRFNLQIEAMNEDAETQHERLFWYTVLITACTDGGGRLRLRLPDDASLDDYHNNNSDRAVHEQALRNFRAMCGMGSNSVPTV